MPNDLTPPSASIGDHLHLLVRAVMSAAPIGSGPALELFNHLVAPPLERRRDEWMADVAKKLAELSDQGKLFIEKLPENEQFITAVVDATTAALKTHNKEKRAALRNAVINSALPQAPVEAKQQIFIRWVDELTGAHLQFLTLFSDPAGWFKRNGKQPPTFALSSDLVRVLKAAYPDLANDRPLYELIAADLKYRNLFDGNMHTAMSATGALEKRTTDMGKQFADFISEPSL